MERWTTLLWSEKCLTEPCRKEGRKYAWTETGIMVMLVVSASKNLKQKDFKFQASLSYMWDLSQNKTTCTCCRYQTIGNWVSRGVGVSLFTGGRGKIEASHMIFTDSFTLYVCMEAHTCQGACVEIRGHFWEMGSLFLPYSFLRLELWSSGLAASTLTPH